MYYDDSETDGAGAWDGEPLDVIPVGSVGRGAGLGIVNPPGRLTGAGAETGAMTGAASVVFEEGFIGGRF